MTCRLLAAIVLFFGTASFAKDSVQRPPIYGLSHVRIRVIEFEEALSFYQNTLGLTPENLSCDISIGKCYRLNDEQIIQLHIVDSKPPQDLIEEIAFRTSDVSMMSKYLVAQGLHPEAIQKLAGSILSVAVTDPEGHRILFEQLPPSGETSHGRGISNRLIHTGFVSHDRAAEDHFYKDILGFRPYWHGGMKDDQTDWVSLQVSDGTDWVEFMVNVSPNADHHTLGVMNHIALGVRDIHAAQKQLIANGWKPKEEPKLGRDGKWQLNLYDPDDTRVEFMEFTPTQKPCCSEFTAPHPKP